MKEQLIAVIADTVPITKVFRTRGKWWKKTAFNKAQSLDNHHLFLSLTEFVAMFRKDLPEELKHKCILNEF